MRHVTRIWWLQIQEMQLLLWHARLKPVQDLDMKLLQYYLLPGYPGTLDSPLGWHFKAESLGWTYSNSARALMLIHAS